MRWLLSAAVVAAVVPPAASGLRADTVLHPGHSKKIGRLTVVCTTGGAKSTKTRLILHPGFQVKVRGHLIVCKSAVPATPSPTPSPTPPTPAVGVRSNPYPLNANVAVQNWTIHVNSVKFNDWADVQAANMFNDPPAIGWEDVIINVTMTYQGASSGTPWLDFDMKYVGASNVAYPLSGFDHYCGVAPSPALNDFGDVFPGGQVTGNVCFQIQTGDEGSLVGYWDDPLGTGGLGPYFDLR